jgi:starch phosphorylase
VFNSIVREGDHFLVLADYEPYVACQAEVDRAFLDREAWARKAIHNTAQMGGFSIDRSVREYAHTIWNVQPIGPNRQT